MNRTQHILRMDRPEPTIYSYGDYEPAQDWGGKKMHSLTSDLNYRRQENRAVTLEESIHKTLNKSTELILKKTIIQEAEINSKIKAYINKEKKDLRLALPPINTLTRDLTKQNIMHQVEINAIADKVYQLLERRLIIEKERRGLL